MEKRPIFGRFILVAMITGLAVWQWYPPTPRDVLEVLQEKFVDRESAEAKRIISQLKQTRVINEAKNPPEELTPHNWLVRARSRSPLTPRSLWASVRCPRCENMML